MRVLITGCRRWYDLDLAEAVLNRILLRYGPPIVVVHGGATGVDAAFDEAARTLGLDVEPHPAAWKTLGNRAGPVRNQGMIDLGADLCVAVHRDLKGSKGTKDCATRALKAGIPTFLIDDEEGTTRRLREGDAALG